MRLKLLAVAIAALCFTATACSSKDGPTYQPRTREYFIAADEVLWDFAPSGVNQITGVSFEEAPTVFTNGPLGRAYVKSIYREYTDATFTTLKPVDPAWVHLGMVGPLIRAVVGDTLLVHFKNNTTFPASVHPHNVLYDKDSEGAPYQDGTVGQGADDVVVPGGTHTYTWLVPERAGPGPGDMSSITSMYHSHVDETRDTNSGLIGAMIITRADMARDDGSPKDVDREFFNLFTVIDENLSLHIDANVAASPACAAAPDDCTDVNPDFGESNLKHTINGFLWGNNPGFVMQKGEMVRWYLMGMGTEVDLHTPHWHGQAIRSMGMTSDMVMLLPASMVVADMIPDNPGTWLYHCHVNDHIDAGMITTFTVQP